MKPLTTSIGRIDATVETDGDIFIFEFKPRGTADEALEQIHEREYAVPYRDDPRAVTLVGASFDADIRNLDRWVTDSDV